MKGSCISVDPKDTFIVTSQKIKLGNSETMTQLAVFFFGFDTFYPEKICM